MFVPNQTINILNNPFMKKRVKIPTNNPAALVALAKRVKEKHLADGDASVLKPLNWQMLNAVIDEASGFHDKAEQLKREMLVSYQQRGLRLEGVISFLRNSRDILTGIHENEMKSLGNWGYDVLDVRNTKGEVVPPVEKQKGVE